MSVNMCFMNLPYSTSPSESARLDIWCVSAFIFFSTRLGPPLLRPFLGTAQLGKLIDLRKRGLPKRGGVGHGGHDVVVQVIVFVKVGDDCPEQSKAALAKGA